MPDNSPPLLSPDRIKIIKKIESKKCAFDILTTLLEKGQDAASKHEIFDALIAREKLGSTCAGNGVAIPRAHMNVSNPIAALLIIKKGLEIETVDNAPIKIFLAFIIPENQKKDYSTIIKKLNFMLIHKEHLSFFTQTDNQTLIANYFESLFHKVLSGLQKNE